MSSSQEMSPGHARSTGISAVVLVLTGSFHMYRGAPGEGVLFCASGLAVAADGAGWLPKPKPRSPSAPGPRLSVLLAGLGTLWLTLFPIRGTGEAITVGVIGLVVLTAIWWLPDRSSTLPDPRLRPTTMAWAALVIGISLWELSAYLVAQASGQLDDFPTLSVLLQPLIDMPIGRAGFVFLWLLGGLALLRWSCRATSRRRGQVT